MRSGLLSPAAKIVLVAWERNSLGRLLRDSGFEVSECRPCDECMRTAEEFEPDAVVVLSGPNIREACEFTVRLKPSVSTGMLPVLHVVPPGREPALRSLECADACLSEPVDAPLLAASVEALARRFRRLERFAGRAGQMYRAIAQHLPDTIVSVVNRQLRCVVAEGGALDTVGLSRRVLEGRHVADIDRELGVDLQAALTRVLNGERLLIERHFAGRVFETQMVPLKSESGEVVAAMLVATDVTERKKSEQALRDSENRYRQLYENSPIGVASTKFAPDGSRRVIDANDQWLAMTGYAREELESGGIKLEDLIPAEYMAESRAACEEAHSNGRSSMVEQEYVRRDGTRVPVMVGLIGLDGGSQTVAFVIDITEMKRLEQRLYEAQKMESIGVLAGGVAHDFNNLLTTILGNASLLAETLPPRSPAMKRVRQIIRNSEHAADLTRQLLAYAGKGCFLTAELDISQAVRDIHPLLRSSVPAIVNIKLELQDGLPPVRADRGQLHQILLNLVINAAEACGERPAVITIRTAPRDVAGGKKQTATPAVKPGRYVAMEVCDNGEGIDPGILPRIFEPFFTTKFTGRGLGLAAVQGIVRRHGGFLEVESSPGNGATFRVVLPVVAAGEAMAGK